MVTTNEITEIIVTEPIAPARPVRTESDDRWYRALSRALANGVELWTANGAHFATSQRDPSIAYRVTATTCECTAGTEGDPICAHRALFRLNRWVKPFGELEVG